MREDLIRRSDVLEYLEAKAAAAPEGSPEEAALLSARDWIAALPVPDRQ